MFSCVCISILNKMTSQTRDQNSTATSILDTEKAFFFLIIYLVQVAAEEMIGQNSFLLLFRDMPFTLSALMPAPAGCSIKWIQASVLK